MNPCNLTVKLNMMSLSQKTPKPFNSLINLPLQLRYVIYLFVSVALISLVLYLRKILLLKIYILYCLVSLNSFFFKPC